jgi:glyoxylate reductase
MKQFSVFVTRRIPKAGIDMLRRECSEVVFRQSEATPTREELASAVEDREALLCLLTDPVDSLVINRARRLKIIANYAVGHDNIDVKAATARGIMVTNTPGVLTQSTADLTWSLLMAIARRIVEADSYVRAGEFKGWAPTLLLGSDVHGKTLGILGLGRIGQAVAARGKGFGMEILYHSRSRVDEGVEKSLGARYVDLPTLLAESDFLSLHTPLTPETRHLIGAEELARMKPSSYLINTSRGPVIDENALAEALENGTIAGAGLDVYENEPEINPRLMKAKNVVLAPHIGSGSIETRDKMAAMAAENIISAMRGRKPPNIVNPASLRRARGAT